MTDKVLQTFKGEPRLLLPWEQHPLLLQPGAGGARGGGGWACRRPQRRCTALPGGAPGCSCTSFKVLREDGACEIAAGSDWQGATRHRRVYASTTACMNSGTVLIQIAMQSTCCKCVFGELRCCTAYSRTCSSPQGVKLRRTMHNEGGMKGRENVRGPYRSRS